MRKNISSMRKEIISFMLQNKLYGQKKRRSTGFWIHPFYLLKSVVTAGAIKQGTDLHLQMYTPPIFVLTFIQKMPREELFKNFSASTNFTVKYWMGGPNNLSYIGSSIHLFLF